MPIPPPPAPACFLSVPSRARSTRTLPITNDSFRHAAAVRMGSSNCCRNHISTVLTPKSPPLGALP